VIVIVVVAAAIVLTRKLICRVYTISGRSVASGLNEDFDPSSIDRLNIDLPPVVLSVAESDLLSSADAVSSYAESTFTNIPPGHQDSAVLSAEFFIPPPGPLTASGYVGSHGSLPEVVTSLDGQEVMRKVGMGQQVLKKSFNQAFGKLSDRMKVPRRQDSGRIFGEFLDSDWDTASLRSGLSDDEDETTSLLYQLEDQLEQPAFEHRVAHSDDVSIAASDTREEDHDIVGEVKLSNVRRVGVLHACCEFVTFTCRHLSQCLGLFCITYTVFHILFL